MLSVILSTQETHREQDIEAFCLSYGSDFIWLDSYTAKFKINQLQALQLKLLYGPLCDDLGIQMNMVIGFDHDLLMRCALAYTCEEYSSQITELGDVLLLSNLNGNRRVLDALDQVLSCVSKEVLETARMYLLTGGNCVLSASLLYIHRNTFTYRLTKFIDQTRIDIRESSLAYCLRVYFTLQQSR